MGSEWKRVRLGDYVKIVHGWPFKSEYFTEERTGRPVVVSIGNFKYTGGFRFESTTVKEYTAEYPKEYELAAGDILLVMTCQTAGGEILGIPAKVPDDGITYLHNQRMGKVVILDRDAIDPGFVFYLALTPAFNRELCVSASGTKILHTAPSRIEAFEFSLPPLAEQKRIAHILGTLDEKIELNRRMNATLEAMARALFQSWFVDFDPVRAKMDGRKPEGMDDATAGLFPDSFQDSPLGFIPKDWETGSILRQANLLSGGTPKTDVPTFWNGDIPWASAKDISQCDEAFLVSTERTITKQGVEQSATKIIPENTTVVVARGATTGRLAMVGLAMAMNQTCYGLRSNVDAPLSLYCNVRYFIDRLVQGGHGSIFDTITTSTFEATDVLLASKALLMAFDERVAPLFKRICSNVHHSKNLSALRSTLLPKLLSGEQSFLRQ